ITAYVAPAGPGVRVDGAARAGWLIPPFYDSMMAKLIVWAPDRAAALARMQRALREFHIEGVPTTIPFHLAVLANPSFATGQIDTHFAETAVSEGAVQAAADSLRAAVPASTPHAPEPSSSDRRR